MLGTNDEVIVATRVSGSFAWTVGVLPQIVTPGEVPSSVVQPPADHTDVSDWPVVGIVSWPVELSYLSPLSDPVIVTPVDAVVPHPAVTAVRRHLNPVMLPVVTPNAKDKALSEAVPHVYVHGARAVQLENAGVNVEIPIQLGPGFDAPVSAPVAVEVAQMRPLTLPPVAVILNFEPGAVAEKLGPDAKFVDQLVAEADEAAASADTSSAPTMQTFMILRDIRSSLRGRCPPRFMNRRGAARKCTSSA
jgi:hypothetical protein